MPSIKVLTGDIEPGTWEFSYFLDHATLHKTSTQQHPFKGEQIELVGSLNALELLDTEHTKSLLRAALWSTVGMAAFDVAGAVAGAIGGGNRIKVTFAASLKEHGQFIGTTNIKTWRLLVDIAQQI